MWYAAAARAKFVIHCPRIFWNRITSLVILVTAPKWKSLYGLCFCKNNLSDSRNEKHLKGNHRHVRRYNRTPRGSSVFWSLRIVMVKQLNSRFSMFRSVIATCAVDRVTSWEPTRGSLGFVGFVRDAGLNWNTPRAMLVVKREGNISFSCSIMYFLFSPRLCRPE